MNIAVRVRKSRSPPIACRQSVAGHRVDKHYRTGHRARPAGRWLRDYPNGFGKPQEAADVQDRAH